MESLTKEVEAVEENKELVAEENNVITTLASELRNGDSSNLKTFLEKQFALLQKKLLTPSSI